MILYLTPTRIALARGLLAQARASARATRRGPSRVSEISSKFADADVIHCGLDSELLRSSRLQQRPLSGLRPGCWPVRRRLSKPPRLSFWEGLTAGFWKSLCRAGLEARRRVPLLNLRALSSDR